MWDKVIGQDKVVDLLKRSIREDRVAHAYLFHGPYGVGKRAAAIAFASALQCKSGDESSCGVCNGCLKTKSLSHPDVHVFFPTPNGVSADEVLRRKRILSEDPYSIIDFVRLPTSSKSTNLKSSYRVSFIREDLTKPTSYSIHEGNYRVIILLDVENMNGAAANAFLKLLEEPRKRTVFILTTQSRSRLIPTMLSRCQPLRFQAIPNDILARHIQERHGIDSDRSESVANSSFGSYSIARLLLEGGDSKSKEDVLAFVRASATSDFARIEQIMNVWKKEGRESIKGFLASLLNWVRDLMLFKQLGSEAILGFPEWSESYDKFWKRFPNAQLENMVISVEEATINIDRNVALNLLFFTLATALGKAMQGV